MYMQGQRQDPQPAHAPSCSPEKDEEEAPRCKGLVLRPGGEQQASLQSERQDAVEDDAPAPVGPWLPPRVGEEPAPVARGGMPCL